MLNIYHTVFLLVVDRFYLLEKFLNEKKDKNYELAMKIRQNINEWKNPTEANTVSKYVNVLPMLETVSWCLYTVLIWKKKVMNFVKQWMTKKPGAISDLDGARGTSWIE